jgi:uracil-DNA glycosylase
VSKSSLEALPDFPLPHPSPRNIRWLRTHPWIEAGVLTAFRESIRAILLE